MEYHYLGMLVVNTGFEIIMDIKGYRKWHEHNVIVVYLTRDE